MSSETLNPTHSLTHSLYRVLTILASHSYSLLILATYLLSRRTKRPKVTGDISNERFVIVMALQ